MVTDHTHRADHPRTPPATDHTRSAGRQRTLPETVHTLDADHPRTPPATDHTQHAGRLRRLPLAALSRLSRLGDIPVVIVLAWAGWLAVPWSFSGLAQARAAAAAAATNPEP
ncbi:hypothetical protein HII36_37965, partial [Nonomuraea sp. NN258]|uniref:hypothetical protein n=1 Tax=Nonomuraea antri TaxID=2730852 RepID=UPI00156851B8